MGKLINTITKLEHVTTFSCDYPECTVANTHYGYNGVRQCKLCDNYCCPDHQIYTDYDLVKGMFSGDYPDYYCILCWKKGEPILNELYRLREEWEKRDDELREQWRDLCKKSA